MKFINYFVLFLVLLLSPILRAAPTNDPAFMAGALRTVMVDSNGVLAKPLNFISTNNIFTKSTLLVGTNMVFVTNLDGSVTISSTASGDVFLTNFDNVTILTNGGVLTVDTNVLASRAFLTNYINTATNGFVTQSITNGLAGTNQIYTLLAGSGVDIATNGWELTFSGNTNILATRIFLTNYLESATNGFVTSSITNGLAGTNLIYSVIPGLGLSAETNGWVVTLLADTNTLASRVFLTNYVNAATNLLVHTNWLPTVAAGTNVTIVTNIIDGQAIYSISSIADTNYLASRYFLTNYVESATNNNYISASNLVFNATNSIVPFSTNQASMTFTNGININTNGSVVLHQVGQDSATDYARGIISNTASGLIIGSEIAGTGTSNSAPVWFKTWGTNRIGVSESGHLIPMADATYDLGPSTSFRFRTLRLSANVLAGGDGQFSGSVNSGNDGNLAIGTRIKFESTLSGRLLVRNGSTTNLTMLSTGAFTTNNPAMNFTNEVFSITDAADYNGERRIFVSDPKSTGRTNWLGGTTTITNLVADYAQTNLTQDTNLVFYLDLSIPFHRLVITNTATTSITIHTTNRPAADNIVRVSRLKILQNMTNSLPLTFNSSWTNFVGNLPPSALASNVWGVLSIDCDGPSETNVLAGYAVQPY